MKERAIYVYILSQRDGRYIERTGQRTCGTSISKFVIEHVENSLQQDGKTDFKLL
jgi:hypothetical protein